MDSILHHAKIATNSVPSFVEAVANKDGKISAAGTYDEILRLRRPETDVIDGKGRGVSADLLYGFGHIILQSHRRDSVEACGALVEDAGTGDREASATPTA